MQVKKTKITKNIITSNFSKLDFKEIFGTFEVNEVAAQFKYTVRIIACIPSEVGNDFKIEGPGALKCVQTYFGPLELRSIYVRWEQGIKPKTSPHDIWAIIVSYTPDDIDLDKCHDKGIQLFYKFGPSVDGQTRPRLSRGTVVSTASPRPLEKETIRN